MAPCAIHRVFFLSTMVLWMFATMYLLRAGSGTESIKDSLDTQNSMDVMEELERQNHQLKAIAYKLSKVELDNEKKGVPPGEDGIHSLLDTVRIQLDSCMEKNKRLNQEVQLMKIEGERNETRNRNPSQEKPKFLPENEQSMDVLMRSTYNNILELWYSIKSKLSALKVDQAFPMQLTEEVNRIIEDLRIQKSASLIEVELLQDLKAEVQAEEMKKLQELVQKRIYFLQNPDDCENAKKLVCSVHKGCGFGCQLHHVAYCFLVAIGTERTLILESTNWRYSPKGWESVFLPLSKSCTTATGTRVNWRGEDMTKNDKTVSLMSIDGMIRRPPYLPLSIPEDLAPKLVQYHGNPAVWWLGQIVSYLVRPQTWLKKQVAEFEQKIGFSHPVAGIHVRRTDKIGTEAAFHSISEYMNHVIDWFDKEDMKRQRMGLEKINPRKVYVASDDGSVLPQATKMYPGYQFLGDPEISKSAGTSTRYSKSSLTGVMLDIYLLSMCDYLVGTFSSQISRVAYELMQTFHPDASSYIQSLDDIFYFGGQGAHSQKVVYDHKERSDGEIELRVGDVVGIAGNHWDGFSKGLNRRTGKSGLYPSYKVREVITTAKFPIYPKANELTLEEDDGIK